ncbi:MAG: hypothetical protein ACLFP2_01325 [Candidatus Woesearchaeota archaeon]
MVEIFIALGLLCGVFLSWIARGEVKAGIKYLNYLEYAIVVLVSFVLYLEGFLALALFSLVGLILVYKPLFLFCVMGVVFGFSQLATVGFLVFVLGLATGSKITVRESCLQKIIGKYYYVSIILIFVAITMGIRILLV